MTLNVTSEAELRLLMGRANKRKVDLIYRCWIL